MNKRLLLFPLAVLLCLGLASSPLLADHHGNKDKEWLAESWVMTAKADAMPQLEKALMEHVKHRQDKEDPRNWKIYSPVFGDDLNRLLVRAGGITWADMDSYKDWVQSTDVMAHWEAGAGKHVAHYAHHLAYMDSANSHWGPDVKYNYVWVTTHTIKPGHGSAVSADIKVLADAAKAEQWPYHWGIGYSVSGENTVMIAIPYESWSAMAKPETSFMDMLAKHMQDKDKAKETMKRWASHFTHTHENVWALRSDLMPKE